MTRGWKRTRTAAAATALTWLASPTPALAQAKVACIAAADRGQELRDQGKYLAARDAFVSCAREACPALVARSCLRWLADVDAGLPTIVVAVRDAEEKDVAAARVLVDGVAVAERTDGMPLAIDPGEHVVRVERVGSAPAEVNVVVRAGEKGRAIVVKLRPNAPPVPAAPSTAPTFPAAPPLTPSSPSVDSTPPSAPRPLLNPRNVTVLSLLGAAAASTAAAAYFGAAARSEASTAAGYRTQYPSNACARATSGPCALWSDAVDSQNRDAIWSDALFAAAGALAVGAVATWLLWPRAPAPPTIAVTLEPGRAGLRIGGSF